MCFPRLVFGFSFVFFSVFVVEQSAACFSGSALPALF